MYAVLHSPTYRQRYTDQLRVDFPRIPFTGNRDLFRSLRDVGKRLVDIHLMRVKLPSTVVFPVQGAGVVETVRYEAGETTGRVWINKLQYFDDIPHDVWNFRVGGYQVCYQWLKDRRGRKLEYDDFTYYGNLIAAVQNTLEVVRSIDPTIEKYGGWPLQ